jgi:hypothetical protein
MLLVKAFDYIGNKMGQAFGIVFKIILPFLITLIPIDQVCAWLVGTGQAKLYDFVLWAAFLCVLIWFPKIASVVEFFIIGFALVVTVGFGTIDHLWGWCVMIIAALFLFFKLLCLLAVMIKRANLDNSNKIQKE